MRGIGPKANNIYTVGTGSLQMVLEPRLSSDPKRGSCIPWNPTPLREAHRDMLIRSGLPLMCRGLFPHCSVLWGRTKP